jgi:hypothetical protein
VAVRFVRTAPKPSPVGKVPRNEADEVLAVFAAQNSDTSLVEEGFPLPKIKNYRNQNGGALLGIFIFVKSHYCKIRRFMI